MITRKWRWSLPLSLCLLSVQESQAQECECDHRVEPSTGVIRGDELGVAPGEVICITGGQRDFLRIYDMAGTADQPIIIKNCDGQVEIDNNDRGYGLTLEGSEHVQVTGTGDDDFKYGFKIRASKDGPDYSASCIVANAMSTDYELDHIEAYECGFAGVSAKTDPTCEERDLSSFVQKNSRLHHLYLHDTGGEGIYFGSTGFPSRSRNCDGVDVDLIPHSHEGVWIHNNIIEDTGWDGAQVGVSPKDCYVYQNRIARVGLAEVQYQMQGLQIGGNSSCEIFDNFIAHGKASGIIVLDAGDTLIKNNVLVDFLQGIYINDRDSEVSQGAQYRVVHNTVVQNIDRSITLFGARSENNALINNLVVDGGEDPIGMGNEVDGVEEGNLVLASLADAFFSDPVAEDYRLQEESPAVDAGVDASEWEVAIDQLGAKRDETPDAGAFEYGAEPPETPVSPPGPGENPGGGDDGSPSDLPFMDGDESGCSCSVVGAPRSRPLGVVLGLLGPVFWLVRRRAAVK